MLDLEDARAIVGSIDQADAPIEVIALSGGENSAVFEVRSQDGPSLVIKTYSEELHWKMRKELLAYGLLEATRPRIPLATILAADDSKRLLDRNYLVMTTLEGESLVSVIDRLDADELDVIDRETGAALAEMHTVELDAFGYLGQEGVGEPYATNRGYMTAQFTKKLSEFDALGGELFTSRAVRRYVDAHVDLFDACSVAAFCHDDCHEGNILVAQRSDGWHVSGILDLENAVSGDPLLDLAKTEAYRRRRTDRRLRALIDGHGSMPEDWRTTLDLYTVYHWLELWDWFAAHDRREPLSSLSSSIRKVCDPTG